MPSEPTRYQYSSRLAFQQKTPAFIQRLKNQVSGISSRNDDDEPDFEEEFSAWQASGSSGRPPVPSRPSEIETDEFGRERQRPPIPERPDGDEGSADDDDDDERPVVVVLKKGKHLSAWEVENEKRKGELPAFLTFDEFSVPSL